MLQNKALRFIDFSPIGTTILPIYAQFKVLPLNYLIKLQQASYMFSYSHNLLPTAFSSYCSKPTHRYQTIYAKSNFVVPKHISQNTELSIKGIGPKLWADISEALKQLSFCKTFTKHLKNLYLGELPTNKRTTKLNLKKKSSKSSSNLELFYSIFGESDEESFLGFESFEYR